MFSVGREENPKCRKKDVYPSVLQAQNCPSLSLGPLLSGKEHVT